MSLIDIILILWRRSCITAIAVTAALAVAALILVFFPSRYDATATATIDPKNVDPVTSNSLSDTTTLNLDHGNIIALITSVKVARDVVNRLNLAANAGFQAEYHKSKAHGHESFDNWLADALLPNLDAKFGFGTNVLTIKYKANDPDTAAELANTFLAAAIDAGIAARMANAEQTSKWFEPELNRMRAALNKARQDLTDYQQKHKMAANSAAGDTEAATLQALQQQISAANANLAQMQARAAANENLLAADPGDPDQQQLLTLKSRLIASEAQLDGMSSYMTADNPKVEIEKANQASIQRQIDALERRVKDTLTAKIAATQTQIAVLSKARDQAQTDFVNAQVERDKLQTLEKDLEFRRAEYERHLAIADQANLHSHLNLSAIDILDKAIPPVSRAFPKPGVVLPVGLIGGLLMGLLISLIAEFLDRRIRAEPDLDHVVHIPALTTVTLTRRRPLVAEIERVLKSPWRALVESADDPGHPADAVLLKAPQSPEAAQFRTLQAMISAQAHDAKTIVVVSVDDASRPSYTAANLALAFAHAGHNTLLVEADLGKSTLPALFGLDPQAQGLSDLLTQFNTDAQPPALPIQRLDALDVITAGSIADRSLIASAPFGVFASKTAELYDIVIYIAPAVLESDDAYSILAQTQGLALIKMRQHATRVSKVRRMTETMERFRQKSIGAVFEKA